MKILITGGHFSPAFSVIQELKKRGHEVIIVGRKNTYEGDNGESFEYKTAKAYSIPFFAITTGRLQRTLTKHSVHSLVKLPYGFGQALLLLKKIKPDIVLTFGGYIGLPVAAASSTLGIPVVIHEQTQGAGLANKIISRFADKICISFESSASLFPKEKIVTTGNPIREEVFTTEKKITIADGKLLYVTGGSGGSHFLNILLADIIPSLVKDFVVVHQTGDAQAFKDYDRLQSIRSQLPEHLQKKYSIHKHISPSEIGWIYKNTSLVISRSGINTILELIATNTPAILIPIPHGQHGEQLENAKLIERLNLGTVIEQKDATADLVLQTIQKMMKSKKNILDEKVQKTYVVPDAGKRIVNVLELVYEKKHAEKAET